MSEWRVRLTGDNTDLKPLTKQISSSVVIIQDDQGYWLGSPYFVAFTEPREVLVKAKELLASVNGAGKVFLSGFAPVQLGHVVQIDDSGVRHNFASISMEVGVRVSVTGTVIGSDGQPVPQPPPPQDIASATDVAHAEKSVERALRFFGLPTSWFNLYKVYELIKEDTSGVIVKNGWATQSQVDGFTYTANNASASGDDARHAVVGKKASSLKPMTLQEGEDFIRSLLQEWLRAKPAP